MDEEQPELAFSGISSEPEPSDPPEPRGTPPRLEGRPDRRGGPERSQFFRAKRGSVLPVIGLVGAVATVAFFLWIGRDEGEPTAAVPPEELAPVAAAAPDFEVPFPEAIESPSFATPGLAAPSEPDPSVAPPPAPSEPGVRAPSTAPPAQVASAPGPAVSRNGFAVQLLAARSEADVGASWEKLRGAYPDLLASLSPTVARLDRAPGDTFYRLRAGPLPDRSAADALCKALSARQQSCFVVSPGS